jgi:hypothetical protein
MINYNWVIVQLNTAPSEDALTNVVKAVKWRYEAYDEIYNANIKGEMICATPSDTDFTAYDDLTQDQVITWLEAGLDVDKLKANLDQQIEDQKNPPIVNLPLPWNK